MNHIQKFSTFNHIQESVWPKADLSDTFAMLLSDELKKHYKGIFYVKGKKLFHNDKPLFNINSDTDNVKSIVGKVFLEKNKKHIDTITETLNDYIDEYAKEEKKDILFAWKKVKEMIKGKSVPTAQKKKYMDTVYYALVGYVEDALGKKGGKYIDTAWDTVKNHIMGHDKVSESKSVPKRGTPDYHEHKIAVDTVKNPNKGMFMGGPSAEEAEETLRKKFGYSDEDIKKMEK